MQDAVHAVPAGAALCTHSAVVERVSVVPQVPAELEVSSTPMLAGASQCTTAGMVSSLHRQSAKAAAAAGKRAIQT